jgi:hypothetical protein
MVPPADIQPSPSFAAQGRHRMAADQDRNRLGRNRPHLDLAKLEMLALEAEEAALQHATDHRQALVHDLAAVVPIDAEVFEVLAPRADAHAEQHAVVRNRRQRGKLLGGQDRVAARQLQHAGVEPQRLGHRGQGRDRRHRIEEVDVFEEGAVAALVGIDRIGVLGIEQAIADGE